MKPESSLDRIRRVRHQISEEFGHDPKRLVEHYMEMQEEFRGRLVKAPKPEPAEEAAD